MNGAPPILNLPEVFWEETDADDDGYIEKKFKANDKEVRIRCLGVFRGTMLDNSTDLTGYMIWPASSVLAQFIAAPIGSELLKYRKVIELGTGAGLTGLYCAHFASEMTLSDNNDEVLDLLLENVERNGFEKPPRVVNIEWGTTSFVGHNELAGSVPFDRVIGSDVIYPEGQMVIPKLLDTARALLSGNPDGLFILSYVPRKKQTTEAVFRFAEEKRWHVTQVPWKDFLAKPPPLDAMLLLLKPL